jgi:hypothetical protein
MMANDTIVQESDDGDFAGGLIIAGCMCTALVLAILALIILACVGKI